MTVTEAERVERRLTQAGFPTVRSRQKTGEGLYAVLLDRITGVAEARTVIGTLRKRGFGEGVLIGQDPPVVRVGEPMPLRRAVDLAERLHAAGHAVRVAVQPGEAVAYTIRHGNFPSKPDARARAQELARLGLSPQVVQIR
jgi:hypothetical protein